jgi:manganese/zinc/iron transport system substrate-binding protein
MVESGIKKLILLALAVLLLAACGRPPGHLADIATRQIQAVATVGMIADVVRRVGGERVVVQGLMGPGIDPHSYKASEGDVIALAEADIVFYNGLHLEAKMAEVFEKMGGTVKAVAVTDGIPREKLLTPPEFEGQYDPHVWFDVTLWQYTVEAVRDALVEIDPGHATGYEVRAEATLTELAELHNYVLAQAQRVPHEQRVLVTAHDAFNYFGRAYGFEVRGLQGISTATEAGIGDVQDLADFIAQRRLGAIFVESSVPVRNVEALQEAVRARGFDVRIGGQLFSDAMGDPATPEGTYPGMVRYNIDTITAALLAGAATEE